MSRPHARVSQCEQVSKEHWPPWEVTCVRCGDPGDIVSRPWGRPVPGVFKEQRDGRKVGSPEAGVRAKGLIAWGEDLRWDVSTGGSKGMSDVKKHPRPNWLPVIPIKCTPWGFVLGASVRGIYRMVARASQHLGDIWLSAWHILTAHHVASWVNPTAITARGSIIISVSTRITRYEVEPFTPRHLAGAPAWQVPPALSAFMEMEHWAAFLLLSIYLYYLICVKHCYNLHFFDHYRDWTVFPMSLLLFLYSVVHACMLRCFSCVWLFATLWTVAHQASLSLGFTRQEYWSGLPFPTPGDLPDSGIKPTSLESPALAGGFFTTSATWEARVQPSELTVSTHISVKCPPSGLYLLPPPPVPPI